MRRLTAMLRKLAFRGNSTLCRSFSVVVYSMCVCLSTSEARSAEEVERQTHTIEKSTIEGVCLFCYFPYYNITKNLCTG